MGKVCEATHILSSNNTGTHDSKFLQHAKWYGLEMVQQEVVAVEPGLDSHSVRLANGDVLHAYAVILAAGCSARKPTAVRPLLLLHISSR